MIIDKPDASGFAPARLQRLSTILQSSVDDAAIPGAVMLVARRGKIAYCEAFGFRDREAGAEMPREAIFRIASMTKPITSLAAMILVEEGKLALGSSIAQFLPALKNLEVGVESADGSLTREVPRREITVQDLLRHTSGFTYGWLGRSAVKRLYVASDIQNLGHSGAEFIAKLAALPLQFEPGAAWGYSVSTDVLGHIIEQVAGVGLDAFVSNRITQPLGMPDTAFWIPEASRGRLAEPQINAETGKRPPMRDALARPARFNGGAGMVSTAADYARFCQCLLDGGDLEGTRLVSRKTVELITADHLPPGIGFDPETAAMIGPALPGPVYGAGFGLGFVVRTHPGRSTWHGSAGDYSWAGAEGTYFWVDPKEELIAILMTQGVEAGRALRPFVRSLVYQAITD